MERETCTGTRKGKVCGAPVFKCGHADCGSIGCEKSGCDNRQFTPIERCKDCGRSHERIKQFKPSAGPYEGAGSGVAGKPLALPSVELLFGAVLGLVAVGAVLVLMTGMFGRPADGAAAPSPEIAVAAVSPAQTFADVCQCYRQGMSLAGSGASVLSSTYRVGFVQCRASFGVEGGEAWTAGWNARVEGKLIGAGCRSWRKGLGR